MRALPAAVFGPVDSLPWKRHLRLPAHLDGTRLALPVARAANGPLLSGKGRAIAPQTERLKLAVISAHPAAVVGTGMPTFRG